MTEPTPEDAAAQQRDAAVAAMGALPPDTTPSAVGQVVGNLDSPDHQQRAAVAAMEALEPRDREDVFTTVLGIPDSKTQRTLWYVVISTISAAIFVFGVLAVVLILEGKAADAPLALATTALGGIVGLVATNPVRGRQG